MLFARPAATCSYAGDAICINRSGLSICRQRHLHDLQRLVHMQAMPKLLRMGPQIWSLKTSALCPLFWRFFMLYSFVQQGKSPNSHCFFTDLESLKHFQDAAKTKISKWLLLIGWFGEYYDSKGKILSKSLRFFYYFETPKQAAYLRIFCIACLRIFYIAYLRIFCIAYLLRILHCMSAVCCILCIFYIEYIVYVLENWEGFHPYVSLICDTHYCMHKTESACYPLTTPALCTFLAFLHRDSFHP